MTTETQLQTIKKQANKGITKLGICLMALGYAVTSFANDYSRTDAVALQMHFKNRNHGLIEIKCRDIDLAISKIRYDNGLVIEKSKYDSLLKESEIYRFEPIYANIFNCGNLGLCKLNEYKDKIEATACILPMPEHSFDPYSRKVLKDCYIIPYDCFWWESNKNIIEKIKTTN